MVGIKEQLKPEESRAFVVETIKSLKTREIKKIADFEKLGRRTKKAGRKPVDI
ncbi:MAG: hypothetical protein IKS03_00855 [Ruminococcus sp.]|nr:hypothetical protein [Ruminococcus sp.]